MCDMCHRFRVWLPVGAALAAHTFALRPVSLHAHCLPVARVNIYASSTLHAETLTIIAHAMVNVQLQKHIKHA